VSDSPRKLFAFAALYLAITVLVALGAGVAACHHEGGTFRIGHGCSVAMDLF
jgi:hypothetical protein